VKIRGNKAMEIAKTRPINVDQIQTQILKLGDKPFNVSFKNLNYSGNPSPPAECTHTLCSGKTCLNFQSLPAIRLA
jgi:hypothetical protein